MNQVIKFLIPAVCLSLSLSGCNKDKEPEDAITQQGLDQCFAVIKDLNNPSNISVVDQVNVKYLLNWTDATCDAAITGLAIGSQNLPTIGLKNMSWKLEESGWGRINTPNPQQTPGSTSVQPVITDFTMDWLFRLDLSEVIGYYDPVGSFKFKVDGAYEVAGARQPSYMGGTTLCSCTYLPDFEYHDAIYNISLDFKNMTAAISITGAKFHTDMPALDMKFSGVSFTFGDTLGSFVLDCPALTPTMGETPATMYPITNVKGVVFPGHETTLQFDCTPVNDKIPVSMTFHVSAIVSGGEYSAAL